jgi:cell division protein FtsW
MRYAVSILVSCVLALLTLGTVMLCSAPAGFMHHNFSKQLAFCVLGLLACAWMASLDYSFLRRLAKPLYLIMVMVLLGVLIVGVTRGGARRWYNLGFMLLQPSEFAKLALIIVLARYLEWHQRQAGRFLQGLFYPLLLATPVLGLILLEPDYGTTLLLGAVVAILLFLGGVPVRRLLVAALAGLVMMGVFIAMDPVRAGRMVGFLKKGDPTPELRDLQYHAEQSEIAIGSGGLTGFGLGEGIMKMGSVPENHTDFIYSIIGEELGLAATMPVALAYLLFFCCGLYISYHARDAFGLYLGLGITFLVSLQGVVNIGVVTGVLPNKGLPLPFVSYGGSSLVTMLTCVGLLLSVARHAVESQSVLAEPMTFADLPPTPST